MELVDVGRLLTEAQRQWVAAHARLAGAALGAGGEVRVKLVADSEMAAAHDRWSGDPTTTDVLTFDMGTDGRTLDVDAWVCVDEARRQADRRSMPAQREVLLYVLHAMLHCLGHDDADEASSAAMHAREDEVLRTIGVGETFAAPEGGAA